jgi:hypothetical protein
MAAPTVGLHLNFRGYVTELLARNPHSFFGESPTGLSGASCERRSSRPGDPVYCRARWVRARGRLALNDLIARTPVALRGISRTPVYWFLPSVLNHTLTDIPPRIRKVASICGKATRSGGKNHEDGSTTAA